MDASTIVKCLADGVKAALTTNKLFLGIEKGEFENADIHPEYVTTVKVAENLTGPEYYVSLETRMTTLRHHVRGMALMRSNNTKMRLQRLPGMGSGASIDARLAKYGFGKKRLDILVRKADPNAPPVLFVEAKLGAKNRTGIKEDINRIVRLMAMYQEFDLLVNQDVYGAVVFHVLAEGADASNLINDTAALLSDINAHLALLSSEYQWLQCKAGLLTSAQILEPAQGYEEVYDDGTVENVFAKDQFTFSPCLVLLGTPSDIATVTF